MKMFQPELKLELELIILQRPKRIVRSGREDGNFMPMSKPGG